MRAVRTTIGLIVAAAQELKVIIEDSRPWNFHPAKMKAGFLMQSFLLQIASEEQHAWHCVNEFHAI